MPKFFSLHIFILKSNKFYALLANHKADDHRPQVENLWVRALGLYCEEYGFEPRLRRSLCGQVFHTQLLCNTTSSAQWYCIVLY